MTITVHVHPRASRAKAEWKDGVLELWVTAPPVEGAANEAVLNAVAHHFGVRRSTVQLRAGGRGRTKLVEIATAAGRSSSPCAARRPGG